MVRKLGTALIVIFMLQASLNALFASPDSVVHADTIKTVYETSFDDPSDSDWLMHASSYDTAEKRTGTHSLKYITPPGPNNPGEEGAEREGPSIRFPANPGSAYEASIWTKTTGLKGEWAGAMFRIAFFDGKGKRIDKVNNNPLNSLGNWQLIKLPTLVASEEAKWVEITLFAYGGEGTMWFDDLLVTESQPPLFTSKLDTPNYRGYLIPGGNPEVKVVTRGTVGIPASLYTTTVQLVDASDQVVEEQIFAGQLSVGAVFDTSDLPVGKYEVLISTGRTDDSENVLYSEQWLIEKVSDIESLPQSFVDDFGRFWKDGELHFPIGIYTHHVLKNEMEDLLGSAINMVMPYNYPDTESLDLAHDYGINVIFSLKGFFYEMPGTPSFIQSEEDEVYYIKQFVEQYKDHPALLAWYLSDETSIDKRLPAHYKAVVETDSDHPAYMVDYRKVDPFIVNNAADLYGVDMYPVSGKENDNLKRVSDMQQAMTADLLNKGQWAVVQAHNLGNYEPEWGVSRGPTVEEMRNMSWQYIAEGAKGIMFYSLFDLMEDVSGKTYEENLGDVKAVAQELENMAPVILSVDEAPQVDYSAGDWLNVMVKSYNGNLYIVAVNNSKQEQSATFTAAEASGMPIQVWNEDRALDWNGNQFTDTFAPHAVHIYEIGTGESIPLPEVPEWAAESSLTISDVSQSSVKLSWPEATNDAASYRIYVDGKQKGEVSGAEQQFVVSGLTANTTYTFTVTAVNTHDNESRGLSKEATTLRVPSSSGVGWIPSGNADLKSIAVVVDEKELTLTPSFSTERNEYYAETESDYAEISALPSHASAKITLQGKELEAGGRVELVPGQNKFELVVEAEDKTKKSFFIIINRITKEKPDPIPDDAGKLLSDIKGHWAEAAIRQAVHAGIVKGYPDNSFKPNSSTTRAEFIVMLMNQLKHFNQEGKLAFTDKQKIGDWAIPAIARAVDAGIINGYADGSFRPNEAITRAEMAAILSRALQLTEAETSATGFADDNAIPSWAKSAVQAVQQLGLIEGRDGNRFAPNDRLTRAESVVVLLRLLSNS
ncbi:S-layer homology domain-containing protein [Paenibacillus sp. GXUN7292]|uniref:S-layer homology domain-containing protein n=1 Tax=Paenibacillus sp. GXUN7292 TaxID=3422499 RepID=UPI003D7EA950